MSTPSSEDVPTALLDVIDPELGYNIVDIGLIYEVVVDTDGRAAITMTTTTPGCPATAALQQGVHERASNIPGITEVDVRMVWTPPWTPQRMSIEAQEYLGMRR